MIKTAKTEIDRATSVKGPLGAVFAIVLSLPLLFPHSAGAQDAPRHDVHAVGPGAIEPAHEVDARTTPSVSSGAAAGDVTTQIYRRKLSKNFREFGKPISRRVLAITPVGEQLAVLTDDGNWMLQSEDGAILGLPLALPDARLLDLASDRDGLYAVAKVRGGVSRLSVAASPATLPATSPTTSPAAAATTKSSTAVTKPSATGAPTSTAAATTQAASRPQQNVPDMLSILMYGGGGWQPVGDVPSDVARPIDTVSLLINDRTPFLLVREAPGQLRLWRLDGTKWREVGQAKIPEKTRIAPLIPGGAKPTVWLSPALDAPAEPDHVLVFDAAGLGVTRSVPRTGDASPAALRPATNDVPATTRSSATSAAEVAFSGLVNDMKLASTAGTAPNVRSAAFAFNYFRSITFKENAMSEQAYDGVSFAAVETARLQTFDPAGYPYFDFIRYGLVAAAMAFAIMSSLRRRAELADLEIDPDELPLAPLGQRLLAGIIDAAPLIAGFFIGFSWHGPDADSQDLAEGNLVMATGFAVYFVITLLTEVFAGRSFGKMICGLRVISVTGQPATRSQLATRNLLRIIDVLLQLFPLLLIPFSPLRQRAGDAAAGTIVVTIHPQPKEKEEAEE